ncbi:MAG: helicase C-terminal domain-containing protein, partial [Pseudomonadota bacterium]
LLQAQGGTYLVALPSFAYLEMLTQALHAHSLEARIIAQTRQMSSGDQSAFLAQLASAGAAGASVLGCVVLGGVFAESVDYSGITLAGVVCVGVGLAPPSAELRAREAHLRDHHDAYRARTLTATLPAMTKIVQMAGRLLRSPEDRGVLCLVDDRFAEPDYRQFFPTHWVPKVLRAAQLTQELERFWSSG